MESTVRSIPQFDVLLSSIRPASDRKALSCAPAAAPAAAQPKKRVNPKKLRTATGPGSCELNPPARSLDLRLLQARNGRGKGDFFGSGGKETISRSLSAALVASAQRSQRLNQRSLQMLNKGATTIAKEGGVITMRERLE
ncbi:hypothetical protein BHE74_00050659 [Ensete ventricosum]|nr:hypothetical protein BHE74_00050659 [Ensete ventricosum]